jgi:hypothetical protein
MLTAFTSLPGCVTMVLRGMPPVWRGRHRRIVCWLVFRQAVPPGRTTLAAMAPWTPATITAWRGGRLRKALSWTVHLLVGWRAQARVATVPPPTNGVLALCGEGSHAATRGTNNPVAQTGRISQQHPWFFGLRCVLVMAAWDGERVPAGLRLLWPKRHTAYRSAKTLWRAMVGALGPPPWAPRVVVGGDAASGAKATMRRVQDRDKTATARRWGFVCAIARTWKTVAEPTRKHLVTPWPPISSQRPPVPREGAGTGHRTFWTYQTRVCVRHGGDVTWVLSKKERNTGPPRNSW